MVRGIPRDRKVQNNTGSRMGKFMFEHLFSGALGGFCSPPRHSTLQHEHAGHAADSCSRGERPGAGSDLHPQLLFQVPPRLDRQTPLCHFTAGKYGVVGTGSSENPPPLSSCHLSFSTLVNKCFYKVRHLRKA